MKKQLMAVACLTFASLFAFGSCGVGDGGSSDSSDKKEAGYLQVKPQDLGADFNSSYYPVLGKAGGIKEQSGQIDVAILFEGTEPGWEAVAEEYSRLHRGQVVVKLDNIWTASNYPDKLNGELTNNQNTKWDIVQGNLAAGTLSKDACINLRNYIGQENGYAGGKFWSQVLEKDAYLSDKTGATSETYIMNTEGLETAWFVNDVAFKAAVEKGYAYTDENGVARKPKTWTELMDLCKYMELAGYENPLGISLTTDSIGASQFTWLLRIYGDLYYRNEYNNIMVNDSDYKVDLTIENPEAILGYTVSYPKLVNTIFDEFGETYVGPTSSKFQDFLKQFSMMAPYLREDAHSTSMTDMRNLFQYQEEKNQLKAPQIMLDYVGAGLGYASSDKIEMDFFDYPIMESVYIEEGTLIRDVGGNGGYLSVVDHPNDREQNNLSVDFMKFFMSPYGQTVYYDALSTKGVAPKGLTLVKNDLVRIPQVWKDYFQTDKISFTGLSDSNSYISFLIRSMNSGKESTMMAEKLWIGYLMNKQVDGRTVTEGYFGGQWYDALLKDWDTYCKDVTGWAVDCWKYPAMDDPYYGG